MIDLHTILQGDGEIGFDDFQELMRETILRGIQENDLMEAFQVFDSDKDGLITAKELQESLKNLGESIGIEDAMDMLKDVDSNDDGFIDFEGNSVAYH